MTNIYNKFAYYAGCRYAVYDECTKYTINRCLNIPYNYSVTLYQ